MLDHGCSRKGLLHSAITCHQLEATKLLLEYKVDPNELYNGQTPLLVCLKNQVLEFARLVLESGADPYVAVDGQVVLYYAVEAGELEFVQLLCERCHQVSALEPCRAPLARAIEGRQYAITRYLLSQGANPNVSVDVAGETVAVLDLAVARQDRGAIALLLDCGADASRADRKLMTKDIAEFFDGYPEAPDVADPEIDAISSDLDNLEKTASECCAKVLKPVDDFEELRLSVCINALRQCMRDIVTLTQRVKGISTNINAKRADLLKIQFTARSWAGSLRLSEFKNRRPRDAASTGNERFELLALNKRLQSLYVNILRLHRTFRDVRLHEIAFMDSCFTVLKEHIAKLDEISTSQLKFLRMGFRSEVFGELLEENVPKRAMIAQTITELTTESANLSLIFQTVERELQALAR